jgi:hypothetical protein
MAKFLRKILLIDFIVSIFGSKQAPHLRFAGFLTVFSYMWLTLVAVIGIGLINTIINGGVGIFILQGLSSAALCFLFFFLYRYTSKIIKSYTEEEIANNSFLKFLNPLAPIIYTTTTLLIILTILNIIMLAFMIIGTLIFFIGIIITFGLLLLNDDYKMDNFISIPKTFFRTEEHFLDNVISLEVIFIFLIIIYFLIPVTTSLVIILKHRKKSSL